MTHSHYKTLCWQSCSLNVYACKSQLCKVALESTGWCYCFAGEKSPQYLIEGTLLKVSLIRRLSYLCTLIANAHFLSNCSLILSAAIIYYYILREQDYCDKLPSVPGEHCCQVRIHKTTSIVWTCWKALRMKISIGY